MTPALSYCLLDEAGRVAAARDERAPYYAASAIKLAVMAAAVRAVAVGELGLDDELACPAVFPSGVAGAPPFAIAPDDADAGYPGGGAAAVRELVRAMIAVSSNEATDVLVLRLGLPAVAQAIALADAGGCRMERLIGDRAADAAGRTNEVTALGLARLMGAIATGRLADAGGTAFMRECLAAQRFPVIGRALPAGGWGSKSGWVDGVEHDVAFVDGPAGTRVLAVLTAGHPGREGQTVIEGVARELLG